VNEDIVKGKWSGLKGEAKKKWGKLTNDNQMKISGQKEKLVGALQTKYGYAKEKAGKGYKAFHNKIK